MHFPQMIVEQLLQLWIFGQTNADALGRFLGDVVDLGIQHIAVGEHAAVV